MSDYPDYNVAAILKGTYAGDPKAIAVDVNGYMIAMLSALFGGNPTNLQCDASGNIKINLDAQDLAELINRNKFGTATRGLTTIVCAGSSSTGIFNIYGKGYCYGLLLYIADADVSILDTITCYLDYNIIFEPTWQNLKTMDLTTSLYTPAHLMVYDVTTPYFSAAFLTGYTFETHIGLKYTVNGANAVTVTTECVYALI